MTDHQPVSDDFERALLRALRSEAYSVPLRLTASDLAARTRPRASPRRVSLRPLLATALVAVAIVLAMVALPRLPALFGPAASGECAVSPVTRHGGWWQEIGGDHAFFHAEPTGMYAGSSHSWLLHVRFEPDAGAGQAVSAWAEKMDDGTRVDARLNGPANPSNIYRYEQRAPDLPGGWYLFEQAFPTGGCWRLTAAIDGVVAGTAVVRVDDPAPPTALPRIAGPTPHHATPIPSGTAPATPIASTAEALAAFTRGTRGKIVLAI